MEGFPHPFKIKKLLHRVNLYLPFNFDMMIDVLSKLIEKEVREKRYETYIVNGPTSVILYYYPQKQIPNP